MLSANVKVVLNAEYVKSYFYIAIPQTQQVVFVTLSLSGLGGLCFEFPSFSETKGGFARGSSGVLPKTPSRVVLIAAASALATREVSSD